MTTSNLKQEKKTLLFETDWLASTPVFYNLKNNLASKKIYDVLPKDFNLKFHPEGLSNYFDFGYCYCYPFDYHYHYHDYYYCYL